MYMDIHICRERRPSMYRRWMNASEIRKEKMEKRRREKGQAWDPTRVLRTYVQLGSP